MSLNQNIVEVTLESVEDLEDVAFRLEDSLKHHSKLHKDFSAVIEKDLDNKKIIVKTLYLEEYVN